MLHFTLWKRVLTLGLCALGVLFALPNLMSERDRAALPSFLPSRAVNLGLDLQGGSQFLLEVAIEDVWRERMETLRADMRTALREGGVRRFSRLQASGDSASVRITSVEDVGKAGEILETLVRPVFDAILGTGSADIAVERSDDRTYVLSLTDAGREALRMRAMAQTLEIIRRRVDEFGTREPTIQLEGKRRILVQLPGVSGIDSSVFGKTARLAFHMVAPGVSQADLARGKAPPGVRILPGEDGREYYAIERRASITGEHLVEAYSGFNPDPPNQPIVNFRLDAAGAKRFAKITRENVGRPFAIVLDGVVISAPVIRSPIPSGAGYIEGDFTVESANHLAILLSSGALPADITDEGSSEVGPELGADSIRAGAIACAIAFFAVIVVMGVFYGRFGLFAGIALMFNLVLLIALLSALGATLTLPGIAGIVLTTGMAVDANVLIFERIREELAAGRASVGRAITAGYERASTSIMDANLTTLIAAIILFVMGSGPVKGFAVTLGLGILTSLFSALMVTRMLVGWWFSPGRAAFRLGGLRFVPPNARFGFMRFSRAFTRGSALAVIAGLVLWMALGLNYGIDFRGGMLIEARASGERADIGRIREALSPLNLGDVAVQEFGRESDVLIRIELQQGGGNAQKEAVDRAIDTLKADDPGLETRRVEVVGPKVSAELVVQGAIAIGLAMLATLFYIWVRFEWQFSAAAVAALTHDVLLTIGVFAALGLEFNLSIIAAILTIVGYSLNDTVVLFDRTRENLHKYRRMPLSGLLDLSLSETLARTLMTSFTTLIALIALFTLGGPAIRGFTFAMIWGVLVGTYSSVFIASPVLNALGVPREPVADREGKKGGGVRFGAPDAP